MIKTTESPAREHERLGSSIGRAAISKIAGWGFESLPCRQFIFVDEETIPIITVARI